MDILKLSIQGISHSITRSGAYALILEETITKTKLPVVIGSAEAQSITIAVEKDLQAPRPLTHDLFTKFIRLMKCKVSSVLIHSIKDGIFYSEIHFEGENEKFVMDARTSDAVSLAIRFDADVFTTSEVLEIAGIKMDLSPDMGGEVTDSDEMAHPEIPINLSPLIPDESSEPQFNYSEKGLEISLDKMTDEELKVYLEEAVASEDFDFAIRIQDEINKRNPS